MSATIEYTRMQEIRGPLLVVGDVEGVGWDEVGEIRLDSGEVRHGVVIDVERDLAVVEVLEGTERDRHRRGPRGIQRLADADPGRRAVARPDLQRPRRAARRRTADPRPRELKRSPVSRSTRRRERRRAKPS